MSYETFSSLLFSSVIFASGGGQQQTASGNVVFWNSMTGVAGDSVTKIVEAYNNTNPAVRVDMVNVVQSSATDNAQLLTAVRGGTGPDVYYFNRPFIVQRAADGALEEIGAYLRANDPDFEKKYVEFAIKEVQYQGGFYGLPFDTDTRALYYNKALLREVGVDPDILDPRNGPPTIALIKEIANKLNQKDASGQYTRIGFIPTFVQGGRLYTWGYAFGGSVVDVPAHKITFTDPKIVASFEWLKSYFAELGPVEIQNFLSTYNPPNNPPQLNPFFTGKLGMIVSGDFEMASLAAYAPNVEYGITYIPVPNQGDKPASWSGGWSFVVPKGSRRIEAAVKFIMFACGMEGQRTYLETAHLPTYLPLLNDASAFTPQHQFFRTMLLEGVSKSMPAQVPINSQIYDAGLQILQRVTVEFVSMGLPFINWIGNPKFTKPSLIILAQYSAGGPALIFLASLRSIPKELLESADLDGAGSFRKFRAITIPMLTPVILYNIIWNVTHGLQAFTQAYLMSSSSTGETMAGPSNSLLFYVFYIYRNAFMYSKMGYAAALSVMLFIASLVIAIVIFRWGRSWVFYEAEQK